MDVVAGGTRKPASAAFRSDILARAPLVERALDLLFPPICTGCRRVGTWLCARCWTEVSWLLFQTCRRCHAPSARTVCAACLGESTSLEVLVAAARFENGAREAVHMLKFHGRHAISGFMGRVLAQAAAGLEFDAIAHVPLHSSRRRERGYDQSLMLARSLARYNGKPHLAALERTRQTRQQALLPAEDRRSNVHGAFTCRRPVDGKRILLVDDVTTTGATIEAAADALLGAGAAAVIGLVFASAIE